MPKIALIIDDTGSNRTKVIAAIRGLLGVAFSTLTAALDAHNACFERPLFSRDDPTLPARFLELMLALDELGAVYAAYELLDNQSFDKNRRSSYYQVTRARLSNMLHDRAMSLEEQRRLGRCEEGIE